MKIDSDHIFRNAELIGAFSQPFRTRNDAWLLIVAKLWLLAAFVGMSLMVISAEIWWWDNAALPARKLALLILAGAALVAIAWRTGSRLLARAEQRLAEPVQGELPLTSNADCASRSSLTARARSSIGTSFKRHARA